MLVLTWIKGEPLPSELVDGILKAVRLERETVQDPRRKSSTAPTAA